MSNFILSQGLFLAFSKSSSANAHLFRTHLLGKLGFQCGGGTDSIALGADPSASEKAAKRIERNGLAS